MLVAACLAVAGCQSTKPAGWSATEIASLARFESPECAVVDPATGLVYVANGGSHTAVPPAEKDKAFISRLNIGGSVETPRWKETTADLPLVSPNGMTILADQLYVADGQQIVVYSIKGDKPGRIIKVPGAKRLAGMANDGAAIYVSDPALWKIFRLEEEKGTSEMHVTGEIKGPPSVLGVACQGRQMFAVSSQLHDVYDVDSTGKADATPFGLDKLFLSPLGLRALDDGAFMVSDSASGQISLIDPDRKKVLPLVHAYGCGDFGYDVKRKLLYVPIPASDRVTVYRLEKREKAEKKSDWF
jgi:DNA-binding beta-propeller fold protein YncE